MLIGLSDAFGVNRMTINIAAYDWQYSQIRILSFIIILVPESCRQTMMF